MTSLSRPLEVKIPGRFSGAQAPLHEAAIAATGFEDFGGQDYLEGLGVLLEAFDQNAKRTEASRTFCWHAIVECLVARLHAVHGWHTHPECLRQPIARPLVITGIPRTGTTALHKLLSVDPQFQGLEMWLTHYPMPRPPRDAWEGNPYYQAMKANLEVFYQAVPQMRAMHMMVADEVDECLEVLKHSFVSNRFGATFHLPAYDRWWQGQDELPAYRYYADVIRLIGTNQPGKRWLLKNPGHVWGIEALLEVFPDACIVHTHREPAQAIPSACSTLAAVRPLGDGMAADPFELGRRESAMWSEAMHRTIAVRKRGRGNFLDVDHRQFHADPLGVVRRIYAHFGLRLDDSTAARMRERIEASPERSHGRHEYTLENFGLSREGLREQFREYIQYFDLN